MRSLYESPQRPHVDFMIEDIPEESCFYNAIMPLTSKGSFLEVWNNPSETQEGKIPGQIIHIPYKSIFIMEQDTVHAGGYQPECFLKYERIGFHINRKSGKYALPTPEKTDYGNFDKYLSHGSMMDLKALSLDVT